MDWLRRLSHAFVAGCAGVVVFYIAIRIAMMAGLMPEAAMKFLASKEFFYRQTVWGGIWGFLFVVPVLGARLWWARGLIVGLLASLAALFYFRAELPPMQQIVTVLVLNMVFWGLAAAFWHDKVLGAPPQGGAAAPS